MEEVSALLYVNRYAKEKAYDVLILDCAPTGESLRFVSLPPTLDWYMTKLFRIQRTHPEGRAAGRAEGRGRPAAARAVLRQRPVARREARRGRRAPEGPEDDDGAARDEPREDRHQGDAAGVHVLRPLRLHGGRRHREPPPPRGRARPVLRQVAEDPDAVPRGGAPLLRSRPALHAPALRRSGRREGLPRRPRAHALRRP